MNKQTHIQIKFKEVPSFSVDWDGSQRSKKPLQKFINVKKVLVPVQTPPEGLKPPSVTSYKAALQEFKSDLKENIRGCVAGIKEKLEELAELRDELKVDKKRLREVEKLIQKSRK